MHEFVRHRATQCPSCGQMSLMLTEKALDADPRQLDLVDWQPVHGECFNGCRVTDLLQEAAAADRPQTKQEPGHWR